jgi:serine/threonine-protein kinase
MLGDDGRVRLVDLGIARIGGLDTLTTTGVVLGSSTYLSPEQAGGAPGDERSDLYALGCVLFEMLTGRPPFTAPSPVAILYLHVNEDPRPPSALTGTRSVLDAVVMRCLADPSAGAARPPRSRERCSRAPRVAEGPCRSRRSTRSGTRRRSTHSPDTVGGGPAGWGSRLRSC